MLELLGYQVQLDLLEYQDNVDYLARLGQLEKQELLVSIDVRQIYSIAST